MVKKIDFKTVNDNDTDNNYKSNMSKQRRGRRPQNVEETKENPLLKSIKEKSVIVNIKAKLDDDNVSEESDDIFIDNRNNNCKQCVVYQKEIEQLSTKKKNYNYLEERQSDITYSNVKMVYIDGSKLKIKLKTDLWCMHDCHPFKTIPCYLVEKYYDGIYYVFGNFCCVPCALSYNIYSIKDSRISERERLTISFYKTMFKENTIFRNAGPRELLIPFGGNKTIEEFRQESLLMDKEYITLIPQCTSLIPQIETITIKHDEIDDKKKSKK